MSEIFHDEQNRMTAEDKKVFWETLCALKDGSDADIRRLKQTIKYPHFLYRYRPISIHSLAALSENKMFFSSSNYYDDPFGPFLRIDDWKVECKIREAWEKIKENGDPIKKIAEMLKIPDINIPKKIDVDIEEYVNNSLKAAFRNVRNELRKEVLSVCFSDLWDNETLWIKYADQYKGYAIIYDMYDKDKLICGTQEKCTHCGFVSNPMSLYPVYYADEKYDATEYARDLLVFKALLKIYPANVNEIIKSLPPHYWERERISLIKKKCHEYDSEWRIIYGTPFVPSEKVYAIWKPYGIILGLNITIEGKAAVLSAANTAGIKNIFQLEISSNDDLTTRRI